MTRHVVLQSPSVNRRQPLLKPQQHASPATRFAEVAGGATAECAAVCCCCPCVVAGLLVLAIYRLPAGLFRRALQQRRRRRRPSKQGKGGKCGCGCGEHEHRARPVMSDEELLEMRAEEEPPEMEEMESEMWENFYSTGFWRSRSQTQRDFN